MEILEVLPHCKIETLDELEILYENAKAEPEKYNKVIYIINLTSSKIMRQTKDPNSSFNKQEYYDFPERFESIFQQKYLKYLSVFINCIYWEDRYPRLIQKQFLQQFWK